LNLSSDEDIHDCRVEMVVVAFLDDGEAPRGVKGPPGF
jgi:hypothetical protein